MFKTGYGNKILTPTQMERDSNFGSQIYSLWELETFVFMNRQEYRKIKHSVKRSTF